MGKMKKMTMTKQSRATSLIDEIQNSGCFERVQGRVKKGRQRQEDDDGVVPERMTKKILQSARRQLATLEVEEGLDDPRGQSSGERKRAHFPKSLNESDSESEPELDANDVESGDYESVAIDEEDEQALKLFMKPNIEPRKTINELILEAITEKQTELQSQFSNAEPKLGLDERVVDVFRGVAKVLAVYRSGKIPKAFKIIPTLENWEEILTITEPDRWSAAAMYMATRIFSSNLKENAAQKFYNLVLLPRIRDDIDDFKRLSVHLFQALSKSLFKPGAFYKGFLLPLCESGTCTLREAVIISSVISKNSIPLLHSAAALLKIAEMDYNGANSIFIQTLLRKKYALPYRVIDGLVYHFLKFQHDKRHLPVLWHQALLTFVQHYKNDMSYEQKEALEELLRAHSHHQITPEIRIELKDSKCRETVAKASEKAEGMSTE